MLGAVKGFGHGFLAERPGPWVDEQRVKS